jgi:L-ascorbate metabolism protein UlaG (beta-lactamase superfamily)
MPNALWCWLAACLFLGIAAHGTSASAAVSKLEGDRVTTNDGELIIHPVNHASLLLNWKNLTIAIDPVGGLPRFADLPKPGLILITDIHGDHLDVPTLEALAEQKTMIVAPPAVMQKLPASLQSRTTVLANGQRQELLGLTVEAIAAYNLSPERVKFHAKGRGNGYLLILGGKRVYVSGDTEDVPEMLALKDIDVAFVCMNLPYTMDVEQAARAVRQLRPKIVYPYHYRGTDLERFKRLVGDEPGIEVRLRDWYKSAQP